MSRWIFHGVRGLATGSAGATFTMSWLYRNEMGLPMFALVQITAGIFGILAVLAHIALQWERVIQHAILPTADDLETQASGSEREISSGS